MVIAKDSELQAASPAELDSIVADLQASLSNPIIFTIESELVELTVGLSSTGCFVQVASASGRSPYFVTVGDPGAPGVESFLFHGAHHTEIPRRNLISGEGVRLVLSEFATHGSRTSHVSWEEV